MNIPLRSQSLNVYRFLPLYLMRMYSLNIGSHKNGD
jgi:hypothetical protein